MINSSYIITEHDVLGRRRSNNGIAYGYYGIDIHDCASWFDGSRLIIDGLISAFPSNIYPIDRGSTLPSKLEVENMQISVCIGASHVAWGSIRIEPTLQSIGEACGVAASIAISSGVNIHDVDIQKIRYNFDIQEPTKNYLVLIADGDTNFRGVTTIQQQFGSIVVNGAWDFEAGPIGWFYTARGNYHDRGTGKGQKSVRFQPKFDRDGYYKIRIWIPSKDSLDMPDSFAISVTISANNTLFPINIYPKKDDLIGVSIGTWYFKENNADYIDINNSPIDGFITRTRLSAVSWEFMDSM